MYSTKKDATKLRGTDLDRRFVSAAHSNPGELMSHYNSSQGGLNPDTVEANRKKYGSNKIQKSKKKSTSKLFIEAFVSPFTAILFCLAIASTIIDVIIPLNSGKMDDYNPATVIIIMTMVIISGLMKFLQEFKSGNETEKLLSMITNKASVKRSDSDEFQDVDTSELVVGDIIHISAGDIIPADVRIIEQKDLTINQSSLTGESDNIEKTEQVIKENHRSVMDYANLAFMGSNVICGSADAIVIATGKDTIFGSLAKTIVSNKQEETNFDKGVNSVSWLLIRFILIMVPIIFFINGFTKGDWIHAFMFAISIAVGLTPEMLPMIVTTCLAKGAISMSKKKTIIKNLNSMQNFGAIDVLCTDKTGTLTQNKVVLEYSMDVHGNRDSRVLRHAFLNSFYQTGLKNLMDKAIINKTLEESEKNPILHDLEYVYKKVDEIPFDFNRRRMSVAVKDAKGKIQLVTKGAIEEMLSICSYAEFRGQVEPLTEELKNSVLEAAHQANEDGLRVLAVAQKSFIKEKSMSVEDEKDMVLMGYLAFLDPPKETAQTAIKALRDNGVNVKILTGDNDKVTRCVCKQVGIPSNNLLLGSDVEKMSDSELSKAVEKVSVFAKLSPAQKARIVKILRNNNHVVGFMGDGINDAAAMKCADIGISVDNAVDIAKESADVILMEKNLMVLEQGMVEGRKTYVNMIKYIKLTSSSNFGNMFSVLIASAFLPFLPMTSLHLVLLGLIYDICCTVIPWDNVDCELIKKPQKWDSSSVGKFMLWFGPISSIFDIITFALIYFVLCPYFISKGMLFHEIADGTLITSGKAFIGMDMKNVYETVFQSSWFVQSFWTQTMVLYVIRTEKLPFIQSRASRLVSMTFTAGIIFGTVLTFLPFGKDCGLLPPPPGFILFLVVLSLTYMLLTYFVKKAYIKRHGKLL